MIRTVIDTNIVVSGLLFGGLPLKLIKAGVSGKFAWITSPFLIEEAERVMRSEKFGLTDREIRNLLAPILEVAEIVVPDEEIHAIKRCPALREFQGIQIIKVRDFMNLIS